MNSFWQDMSYALRVLMKHRGFAAIAILTLALGIGATTGLFSVVNGVLLNPLPYPNPRQLVALAERFPPFSEASIAYPNFLDWVRMNRTFEGLAAYRHTYFNLTGSGEAQRLNAVQVSATFFPLLGTEPVIGRNFSPDDDKQGAQPVAMLSGRFWNTKFGGSPEILGKMLTLDGTGYTVIGVVPENFYFCCESMNFDLGDIYVPIGSANEAWLTQRDSHPGIRGLGRMKPRVTIEQARADMNNIALNLSKAYPDTPKGAQVTLTPLRERMVEGIQTTLVVLLAAAGFVLLIACANVANLLLSRGTGRTREFAIRSALGATQNRIVRQLLTESVLLGVAGGSLGLALAARGTKAALAVLPQTLPRANDVRLDPHVLGFTLIVSILAGVLFGLAPALKTARPDLQEALKEGGRGISGARHRAQRMFVVAELTLAVVLSIGAGLTVRSLTQLWTANWGFKSQNALSFDLAFPPSIGKEAPAQVRAMLEQLPQKLAQIPGVEAASVTDASVPFSDDWEETFWIESRGKPPTQSELPETLLYIVSPDYLRVMGIPLVRGRFFTSQDSPLSRRVAVIDENFAREYFRNQNPIGQQIVLGNSPMVVVGIVGHTEQWGVDDKDRGSVRVQLYALADQMPDVWLNGAKKGAGLVIRMQSPNYPNAEVIRSAMQQINSEQVTYNFRPMDQIISKSLASRRFAMILLSVFAVMALLLASIGIYGVLSYFTSQRTNEIGVRMALGAQSRDVLVLVLSDAGRMIFVGVLMGLIAGAFLATVVKNMLFGVSATDPLTFVVVALLLSAVAFAACYIPARRAANVDPITALRYE